VRGGGDVARMSGTKRGMHGNHQNWKGNKGILEGAPLSLHGGCLATPASRSLPAPSLFASSALTPSQPFLPNHRRRSPRRALWYPLHFFSPLFSPPVIRVSVQRNTDALFFSCRIIPPSHPWPILLRRLHLPVFSVTLFSVQPRFFEENLWILFSSRKLPVPLSLAPAARVGVSSSSANVAHFPHLFGPSLHPIPSPFPNQKSLSLLPPLSLSTSLSLLLSLSLSLSLSTSMSIFYRESR